MQDGRMTLEPINKVILSFLKRERERTVILQSFRTVDHVYQDDVACLCDHVDSLDHSSLPF